MGTKGLHNFRRGDPITAKNLQEITKAVPDTIIGGDGIAVRRTGTNQIVITLEQNRIIPRNAGGGLQWFKLTAGPTVLGTEAFYTATRVTPLGLGTYEDTTETTWAIYFNRVSHVDGAASMPDATDEVAGQYVGAQSADISVTVGEASMQLAIVPLGGIGAIELATLDTDDLCTEYA